MTEDELLALGDFCEGLKHSPLFQTLVSTFEHQIFEHFMTTEPHAKNEREGHYARLNGFKDFIAHMTAFVFEAQKIREASDQKALSEYDPMPDMDEDAQ